MYMKEKQYIYMMHGIYMYQDAGYVCEGKTVYVLFWIFGDGKTVCVLFWIFVTIEILVLHKRTSAKSIYSRARLHVSTRC